MMLSRRGVLRCLTGIIAAPAVIKAGALMRVASVREPVALDVLGNEYEKFVSHFRWIKPPMVCEDWQYVAKIANWEPGTVHHAPADMFSLLPAEHSAERAVPAGFATA